MIQVAQLTIQQKNELLGQLFSNDSYFNPIQDCNNVWFISTQEQEFCDNLEFQWIKTLPLINFCPKPFPPIN